MSIERIASEGSSDQSNLAFVNNFLSQSSSQSNSATQINITNKSSNPPISNLDNTYTAPPTSLDIRQHTPINDSKLEQESIDADRSIKPTGKQCAICLEMFSFLPESKIIPIITACGHTTMCKSCFYKTKETDVGNKKLPSCPFCRIIQFDSPLRVNEVKKDDLHTSFTLMVKYNGRVTDTNQVLNISCSMSTTGAEIRDRANELLLKEKIIFPNSSRSVIFNTSLQQIRLHADTTLQDVGFKFKTDSISILEGSIKASSQIVKNKLENLLPSPNGTFRLSINTASHRLQKISINVKKTDTFFEIARHIFVQLYKGGDEQLRQILEQIGLMLVLPEIGFNYIYKKEMVNEEHLLTLEELKVGQATNHMFYGFGQ